MRSFSLDQEQHIRDFFDKYGLVVIADVLSPEACDASVAELWDFLERHCKGLCRDDVRTWEKWPSLSKLGILGNHFVLSPQFCENRQNPRVHRAFELLFGTEKLHVNVGRASAMRPTRDIQWPDTATHTEGEQSHLVDKPEWRSKEGVDWLHWDMNPFTGATSTFTWAVKDINANRGYDQLATQAVLALSDCAV